MSRLVYAKNETYNGHDDAVHSRDGNVDALRNHHGLGTRESVSVLQEVKSLSIETYQNQRRAGDGSGSD